LNHFKKHESENKFFHWLLTASLWTAAAGALAAPAPVEAFYRDADIAEATLSPSGTKLAFTTGKGKPHVCLYVIDLSPGGKFRQIVQFPNEDVVNVEWVNDSRLIFSVYDSAEGQSIRSRAPGLFSVDAAGGKVLPLVRRQHEPAVVDGWSQKDILKYNHSVLTVPKIKSNPQNEEILLVEYTFVGPHQEVRETPLWINVRTGFYRWADFKEPPNAVAWHTDPAGRARAVTTITEGRVRVYWRSTDTSPWKVIAESGLLDAPFNVHSVDDAGNLYVTVARGDVGENVLTRFNFETGAPESKPVITTPGFDFYGRLISDREQDKPLGVRTQLDAETTLWLDPAMKRFQEDADRLLPGRINQIHCRRCGQADMVALIYSFSDRNPGIYYTYQATPPEGEKKWRQVGKVNEAIDPAQMASVNFERIKARDGRDLPVWITRSSDAKQPQPAVVLVHGGPWVRGSTWAWHDDAQFLASRGYVVIEPEMRGSKGYGDTHFRAGFKQMGQTMQDDVADALRWAQTQGIASKKACIAGASYGGYSALMGLINDPDLYQCGVAWVALADLDLYLSGSWWVNDDIGHASRTFTLAEMVGDSVKDAAMIAANSPVRQAARIKAPVLLAYGAVDRRVPLEHGERLRKAMLSAGNAPQWVVYPDEGHGFTIQEHRIDFARRMEAFLAKHLAP
jgi:dipeptidyl aminopeptidase/acylaminoacyl peptidase